MGKVNRIISNTYNIFVLDILIKVISASFMIYAARVLGVKYFGAFILIVTVVNLYNIFSVLGIRPMAIREIAKSKDNAGKFLNNILGLRLILALIAYTVLIIFVSLVDYHPEVKILLCIHALTLFIDVFSGTFSFVYIAYERMKILRQFSVIMSFLSTGTSFLLLYLGYGVMALVLNAVFFSIVSAVIYGWHIWVRFFPFRIEANLTVWRWILLESLPFALYGIINMITLRGGIFLLSIIKGPVASTEVIGYYSPANSILNPAIKLPHSMRIAFLPIISENMDSTELKRKIVERTTKYLLSIFLGLIVYGIMINALDIFERKELTIVFRSLLKRAPIKASL